MQTFNAYGPVYAPHVLGRAERFAEAIERDPCDVIQLQEVWANDHFRLLFDELTPFQYLERFPQNELENAPGSRKVGLASFLRAPNPPEREQLYFYEINNHDGILDDIREIFRVGKGIHLQDVTLSTGIKVSLLNTHTHPLNEAIRVAQMAELILFVWDNVKNENDPLIFTGDFNATPSSLEMRMVRDALGLRDSFADANQGYRKSDCTLCLDNPHGFQRDNRVIDYVLYRAGNEKMVPVKSIVNLRGNGGDTLSDHYGVRTIFEITDEAEIEQDSRERRDRALKTIAEAHSLIVKEEKDYFTHTLERLDEISARLRAEP